MLHKLSLPAKKLRTISVPLWTFPLMLLLLAFLSFGLLITEQGFYWDDWPSLLIDRIQGPAGFEQFFRLDRPTTHFSYLALMPVFGVDPLRWQVFTLLLRWVCAVLLWWFMRKLWPEWGEIAAWAAVLFMVSPLFKQQPIALTYHQLWLEYVFYLVSLGAMVAAVRTPAQQRLRYWLWTALAVLSLVLNFLISEYFLGVELLRPLILWLAVRTKPENKPIWQQIRSTVLHWLPYLAILFGYLLWRFFFLKLPTEDRNAPTLLLNLLSAPLQTIPALLQMLLQDTLHILVSSWYLTLRPEMFNLGTRFNLITLALTAFIALLVAMYLLVFRPTGHAGVYQQHAQDSSCRPTWVILLGLLIVLIGPLPGWVTGRQVIVGAYSDRLVVPAMFGACIAIAGLIFWLLRTRLQQIILLSLLVGLASGFNQQTANDYRWASVMQNRFFWQLYWRAPSITPQTPVFAYAEALPKTGLYSTAAGINIIYADRSSSGELPYWFFSISREFGHRMYELSANTDIQSKFRQFTFNGKSHNGLIVYYEPAEADCLRLVTPKDADDPALHPLVAQAATSANLTRIQAEVKPGHAPNPLIFGQEPEHGWCYLFQKADLARQNADWQKVAALGDKAKAQGFSLQESQSNTPQEWIPFVEGYAHTGRWEDAQAISRAILEREPKMATRMCDVWQDIRDLSDNAGKERSQTMIQEIGCQ